MLSKKVLGTVLAAAMISTSFATVFADTTTTPTPTTTAAAPTAAAATTAAVATKTGFNDVADNALYANAVIRLSKFGIVNGTADKTFSPDATMTRAEAAKVLVKALGLDDVKGQKTVLKFADLDANAWYSKENLVDKAAAAGLIKGYVEGGKNVFKPDGNVTYGQYITMVVRALGYTEDDLVGDTWPYNYVAKATELGLLDDVPNIDVDANVKRSDLALIADKMMFATPKEVWNARETGTTPENLLDMVYSRLGLARTSGVVLATSNEDIAVKAGKVEIGTPGGASTEYDIADSNIADLVGQKVTAYTKKGDTKIVFAGMANASLDKDPGVSGTVTKVTSTTSPTYNQYVFNDNVTNTTGVSTNGQFPKYNVVYFDKVKKGADFNIPDGTTMKVVNGVAYASKDNQASFVVDSVDTTNKVIKTLSGERVHYIDTAVVQKADGTALKISDLKKYDVIYLMTDLEDAKVATDTPANQKITVYETVTEGKIDSRLADGTSVRVAGTDIAVSDAHGKQAQNMIKDLIQTPFGKTLDFVLDKDGKVVYVYDAGKDSVAANSVVDKSMMVYVGSVPGINGMSSYTFVDGFGATRTFTGPSNMTENEETYHSDYNYYSYDAKAMTPGKIGKIELNAVDGTIRNFNTFADSSTTPQLAVTQTLQNGVLNATAAANTTNFVDNIDDSAVILNKKADGTIEVIKGSDAKTLTDMKASNVQYFVWSAPDALGFRKVIFAYTTGVNHIASTATKMFIFNADKADNFTQVGPNAYNVAGYDNGVAKTFTVSKEFLNQLQNGYTVTSSVYYDPIDTTKIVGITGVSQTFDNSELLAENNKVSNIDATTNRVVITDAKGQDSMPSIALDAKVYVLDAAGKPQLSTLAQIQKGMNILTRTNSSTGKVDFIIAGTYETFHFVAKSTAAVAAGEVISIAGPFNNWTPGDPKYAMTPTTVTNADGTTSVVYKLDIQMAPNATYKYTKKKADGSTAWEVLSAGPMANRTASEITTQTDPVLKVTMNDTITGWNN